VYGPEKRCWRTQHNCKYLKMKSYEKYLYIKEMAIDGINSKHMLLQLLHFASFPYSDFQKYIVDKQR
jgi:hypothetical protein